MMYKQLTDREGFKVTSDQTAEWAIKAIKEQEDERDRLVEVCRMEIERLEDEIDAACKRCADSTAYLRGELTAYVTLDTTKVKRTKTQSTYRLPSGKLVIHNAHIGYEYDHDRLTDWLRASGHEDMIVQYAAPRLSEAKKLIETTMESSDGCIALTADGEVIDGITPVLIPPRFEIKMGGGVSNGKADPDYGREWQREDDESEDA